MAYISAKPEIRFSMYIFCTFRMACPKEPDVSLLNSLIKIFACGDTKCDPCWQNELECAQPSFELQVNVLLRHGFSVDESNVLR